MSLSTPTKNRATVGVRRAGYVVALLVNVMMLVLANIWPRWEVIPFLSSDMRVVMPWVNASVAVNVVVNVVYLVRDPVWLRSVGDLGTLAVGIAVLVRMWQVFPFDFVGDGMDWALVARIVLVLGVFGSLVGMLAALAALIRDDDRH